MEWTILICTLGQRQERFLRLLDTLLPQVEDQKGRVRVLAYWNNFELPLGVIRQSLVEEANGEYISFIDDDDMVPNYFCDMVTENLGKDYVGWRMQAYSNGEKLKPTYHSIQYPDWTDDDKGFYRNISHLNPIKRSIALKASFIVEAREAEDYPWSQQVQPFVQTENYIDSIMYYYQHNTEDSLWRGGKPITPHIRPEIKNKYFSWHPNSWERYVNT